MEAVLLPQPPLPGCSLCCLVLVSAHPSTFYRGTPGEEGGQARDGRAARARPALQRAALFLAILSFAPFCWTLLVPLGGKTTLGTLFFPKIGVALSLIIKSKKCQKK